ncbi:hypothetical protein HPULCUR_007309 [Helicostylum pulchrum]|uniref:Uncharacterized protein n=1 Tax=Helicostylum pulchrum TaxID=562976 RepID=A0ABP9Y4F4_9FUNG
MAFLLVTVTELKDRTDVKALGSDCEEEAEGNILIDNFRDGLYNLFKKGKEAWDEEDTFLMKAVSDYLPLAVKNTMKKTELEIKSFDLFHYAFIVPSEWEEEMRDDIFRPIFVQSNLISNEDHQDRLLFFSEIESIFYAVPNDRLLRHTSKRGKNTILCRLTPEEGKTLVKFDVIRTTNTLYDHPNAELFPKVMKSSSVSVTNDDIEGCNKEFLRTNLFPLAADDGGAITLLNTELIPFDEDQIIEDIIKEINPILSKDLSNREILVSTNKSKYIKAFILMYMIYIKEDILNKLPDQLIFDHIDTKVGYAISIEAILLNNTIGTKDNLRDITFASGLIPKDNDSKKLRITTQGERILPAIQKSLKLECTLKSYFLLCQLHEVYVQLTLNQVVKAPSSEEQEHKSIVVQEEIVAIPNIYDSLCTSMWQNLVQDSSLIELCEMHKTSDGNDIFGLFSSNIKTEFFINLKGYIFDNVRAVNEYSALFFFSDGLMLEYVGA